MTTDTVVGDRRVKAGEWVFMVWASANRDEKLFGEDSDRLRIDRAPNRHMTFGIGGHRCQGSTLARTELRIVVDRLLERLPDFKVLWDRVVGPETIGSSYGQREVPVTFTPGAKVERPAETEGTCEARRMPSARNFAPRQAPPSPATAVDAVGKSRTGSSRSAAVES